MSAIIAKAKSDRIADRYPTAAEFAADLRRFRNGMAVNARSYSPIARLVRYTQRHKGVAYSLTCSLFVIAVISALAMWKVVEQRDIAIGSRRRLEIGYLEIENQRDRQTLSLAHLQTMRDPSLAMTTLGRYSGKDVLLANDLSLQAMQRGVADLVVTAPPFNLLSFSLTNERRMLMSTAHRSIVELNANSRQFSTVARHLSEYGTFVASRNGRVLVYVDSHNGVNAVVEGVEKLLVKVLSPNVGLSISDDGRWTAIDTSNSLSLCELTIHGNCKELPSVKLSAVSKDGRLLAVCDKDGRGALLSVNNLATLKQWKCRVDFYGMLVAADAPGGFLVSLANGKIMYVDPDEVRVLPATAPTGTKRISSAGNFVAASDNDGTVRVWNYIEAELVHTARLGGEMASAASLAVSSDGSNLAIGIESGVIRLISLANGVERSLFGHQRAPHFLRFGLQNDLTSGSIDTLRVWSVEPPASTALISREDAFFHARYLDHATVAAETRAGFLHIVNIESGWRRAVALGNSGGFGLAVSANSQIAVAGRDGSIPILDQRGQMLHHLRGHQGIVRDFVFADARTLLSCGADGTVRRWDIVAETSIVLAKHDDECYRIALEDQRVAVATYDGIVIVVSLSAPQILAKVRVSNSRANSLLFDGDGALVVATNDNGVVKVAMNGDVQSIQRRECASALVSKGPRDTYVSAWADGAVYIARGGETRQIVPPGMSMPRALVSSKDSGMVAVSYANGSIRLVREDGALSSVVGHTDIVSGIEFSPEQEHIVTAGQDGRVLVVELKALTFHSSHRDGAFPIDVVVTQ